MYHTLAYYLASGGSITNVQVPALTDPVFTQQSSGFLFPQDFMLLEASLQGATMQRGYFSSPHLLQLNPLYVNPVIASLLPPANPSVLWLGPSFPKLIHQEVLSLFATDTAAGGEHIYGIAHVGLSVDPVAAGEILDVYATSTSTPTANAWSQIAYSLANNLPVGQYQMIGSNVQSARAIAHRWIFQNQVWRPGNLSVTALGNLQPPSARYSWKGAMGTFWSYALPNLEVINDTADSAHDIYMRLVKVS